jgi:uncharacterized damage-inducible protein DinB
MSKWNKWKHIFVEGEYAKRDKILKDLTFEQVNSLPSEGLHTIYGELWHTTKWQNIVVHDDKAQYERWQNNERYPANPAAFENEWNELVKEFLVGLDKALEISDSNELLNKEIEEGITMSDCLYSLAAHNAYHLGKIVAIRQMIGAWPPKEETKN